MNTSLYLTIMVSLIFVQFSHAAVKFRKVKQCPTELAESRQYISSKQQCSEICTSKATCNAFHFDPSSRYCHLGDACSAMSQWTVGDCDSYVYDLQSSDDTSKGLLRQLQMKLFYRFKKSGLVNEVDPRQFCLTAHDVTVGSDGAEFKGNANSYLITKTPGFKRYLDYKETSSFYVLSRHVMNTDYQTYHTFRSCSNAKERSNMLGKRGNALYGFTHWTKGGYDRFMAESTAILPETTEPALLSVGSAFDRIAYQHFYFNGSVYRQFERAFAMRWGDTTNSRAYDCLAIGHSYIGPICLKGNLYCYGMSTKILDANDFRRLDAYCNSDN